MIEMSNRLPVRYLGVQVPALALSLMKMSLAFAVFVLYVLGDTGLGHSEEHSATLFFSLNLQIFMHAAPE